MVMLLMVSRNRKEAIVAITGSALRSINNWIAFPFSKMYFEILIDSEEIAKIV